MADMRPPILKQELDRFARMDNKTFQAWLSAAEGLTPSQRDEALGVLSGAPQAALRGRRGAGR